MSVVSLASCAASGRAVVQSRDLLWTWTRRIVSARYQQSLLGWLWAIAQPAAQVVIFALIFTIFVPVDTGGVPYVLFSYAAIVPWTFMSTSLSDMTGAIVDNIQLVTKIYFPREILAIACMLARFLDFAVASALLMALVAYYRVPLSPANLALLPLIIAIQLALTLGIGLAAAAANTFLRDVRPLLTLVLQLWFYVSPIIYPVAAVPPAFRTAYALNPMVGVIEGYRAVWIGGPMPVQEITISGLTAAFCLVAGYWFFKKSETVFADIA